MKFKMQGSVLETGVCRRAVLDYRDCEMLSTLCVCGIAVGVGSLVDWFYRLDGALIRHKM